MAKTIKILKNEQIVDLIKKIKTLKGDEVVFDIPGQSVLAKDPHNFSLMKKSAAAMGKTVIIRTDDPNIKSLTTRAGLLLDDEANTIEEAPKPRLTRKVKFSDIGASTMPRSTKKTSPQIHTTKETPLMPVDTEEFMEARPSKSRFSKVTSKFSKFFVLGIVVLVLAVFGLAVLLPKSEITVYARSEPVVRDIEISVDKTNRTINSTNLTVPGEALNREISHTKNFPATGVKLSGTKATGKVQLYNFTKNTLTLKASTTTLIIAGRKYSFVKDVTGLRPTAKIGQGGQQEMDKTSLIAPVDIVAQQVGQDYNAAADLRVEVQNAALGQADVYGETNGAISGGNSTETKIVSQADIDNALKAIQAELPQLVEEEIASANSNDSIKVLSNAVKSEILAQTTNKEANAEANEFDMTIIARVTGLSYNEDDVKTLVIEKINSVLSEDKYLLMDGKQEITASFKSIDIDKGTGVLAVHFETIAAYRVENTNLSKLLAGKDAVEIKEILLTKPEIDRVDVEFSPFFVNKAPRFNGKIYIKTVQSQ